MMRPTLLTLLATLFLALSGIARAETVTLQLWTGHITPERIATIRYVLDAFTALNPDVVVEVTAMTGEEMNAAVHNARRRNETPDILHATADRIVALAADGALDRALTTRIVNEIGVGRLGPKALRIMRDEASGLYDGVPFHAWIQGLIYRQDWFDEAGLDPPDSWEAILAAAERLHDPANGRFGILLGTEADAYAQQIFSHLALSNGALIVTGDGRLVFNSRAVIETLAFMKELARFAPPRPHTPRGRDFYLQGRLAMLFYSTFILDDLVLAHVAASALTGDHFDMLEGGTFDRNLQAKTAGVTLIRNRRSAGFGVLVSLGFFKHDDPKRGEAIARLTRFLFQTDAYIAWLHMAPAALLPVMPEITSADAFFRDREGVLRHYGRPRMEQLLEGLKEIQTFGVIGAHRRAEPAQVLASGIIGQMVHRAIHQGETPEEAVAWATEQIELLLEAE